MSARRARVIAAEVQGQITSAVSVAQNALKRAATLNPDLNALTCLNPDMLADAQAVDARIAAGEALPLAGVPVVIKDNIWVTGMTITNGSRIFEAFTAPEDATAVSRLRDAGAVILGIGTCSEFACKGVTNTPLHGITRNPVNTALTPGGSSGGCAVAVAAGIVPVAIGTDSGGSSRRPPAHVGVVGFKPSQDAVPYGPGFAEPVWGISALCPITQDVADATLVFSVLSRRDPSPEPANLRIAFAPDIGLGVPIDHDVAEVSAAAIAVLTQDIPMTTAAPVWSEQDALANLMALQFSGLAVLYGETWRNTPSLFDPDIARQIETGSSLPGTDVALALQVSHSIGTTLREFLTDFDVLISLTAPCTAWPATDLAPAEIGGMPAGPRDHAAFTPQANHAGLPAISIPCGTTAHNLPVGLQLIGRPGSDMALLRIAERFEATLCRAGLLQTQTKAAS